jgi:ABC-type antimicrobial peptide transport system permease subunit
MYGIAPNFMDVVFNGFLILNEGSEYNGLDMSLSEQLYTPDGSGRAWVGTLYKTYIGIRDTAGRFMWSFSGQTGNPDDTGTADGGNNGGTNGGTNGGQNSNTAFVTANPSRPYEDRVVMRPLAFFDAAPYFRFSKFNSKYQHTVVSYTTWLRQSEFATNQIFSVDDIPWGELLFLIDEDVASNKQQREKIKSELNELIKSQDGVYIYDLSGSSNPIQKADVLLTAFFGFTTAVAMLIASFSLVSSMYTNIYEQTKEIGVVRAIGMRQSWLKRIYMYEAFILVLSSSLLGIIIGSAVGYTLLLQRILFTQLPLPFRFPWQILIIVFTCSLIFAFVSSFGPITSVMKRSIVQILRF